SLELKARELGVDLTDRPDALRGAVTEEKDLESNGWSFEAADASLELLLRKKVDTSEGTGSAPPFTLESYRVMLDHRSDGEVISEATVKVHVAGNRVIATGEGRVQCVHRTRPCVRACGRTCRGWTVWIWPTTRCGSCPASL